MTLTFLFPVVLFSIPIMQENHTTFLENFQDKIQSGILFSTSISILSTIISSYIDNATLSKSKSESTSGKIKDMSKVLPMILFAFILTILGAFYYGQINNNNTLNILGVGIQLLLYFFVQIIYGITDSNIKNSPSLDIVESQGKYAEKEAENTARNVKAVETGVKNNTNSKLI